MTVELFHHGRHEPTRAELREIRREIRRERRHRARMFMRGPGGTAVFLTGMVFVFVTVLTGVAMVMPG